MGTLRPVLDDAAKAEAALMRMLVRREYSALEAQQVLTRKFTPAAAQAAVANCVSHGYLSDERCAQMLLRHCAFALHGQQRFILEARRRGIDQELIDRLIGEPDWTDLALQALQKRCAGWDLSDRALRLKALAMLARRGFSREDCARAVDLYHRRQLSAV